MILDTTESPQHNDQLREQAFSAFPVLLTDEYGFEANEFYIELDGHMIPSDPRTTTEEELLLGHKQSISTNNNNPVPDLPPDLPSDNDHRVGDANNNNNNPSNHGNSHNQRPRKSPLLTIRPW